MPRLFRESPLLGIWEGSGNVICLDVLRAVAKEPASLHAFMSELDGALGVDRRFDTYVQSIKNDTQSLLKDLAGKDPAVLAANEQAARFFVERLALALEAALMIQQAPGYVADLFVARRLAGEGGIAFGALPRSANAAAIVERASFDSTVHG
jgi:putative acyl-CoA dehydrogenase